MCKILDIITKYDLTEEEFFKCLVVLFQEQKAEEVKKLFLKYKDNPYELDKERHYNNIPIIVKMLGNADKGFQGTIKSTFRKERNVENVLYCFLGSIFCYTYKIHPSEMRTPLFLDSSYGRNFGAQCIYDLTLCNTYEALRFKKEHYPFSENLSNVIHLYLNEYKIKKISPTIESFKKHQSYCVLLEKLANLPWEEMDKNKNDFEYLITFIYALKLYVFCYTTGEYLKKRRENNKAFDPNMSTYDLGDRFLKEAKHIESLKNVNLSVFCSDDETPEEFVVRCADYFGIKADEEIKPVADKTTQVKEKQITKAYSEVVTSKIEDFKEEASDK